MVIQEVRQGSEAKKESPLPENENYGVERVNKHSDDTAVRFVHRWPILVFVYLGGVQPCMGCTG